MTLGWRRNGVRCPVRAIVVSARKSTSEKVLFHTDLPARAKDGSAEKVVKKLHVVFKNEW